MACGSAPTSCLARAESKLEASVEKLFNKCGSTEQEDSAAGGGHDAEIELVTAVEDTVSGNVTVERPKRPRTKRPAATDSSGTSHPPKELWGKGVTGLLAGVLAMPTLPFVTSSVSATPECENDALFDSIVGGNVRTIGPAVRFVISSDSSHYSSTNASGAEVDSVIRSDVPPPVTTDVVITTSVVNVPQVLVPRVADKVTPQVQQSIFHESSFIDTIKPDDAGPSHLPGKELSMGSQEVDSKNLHDVSVLHWNIPNDTLLDDLDTSRDFIDHLAPPVLFVHIRDVDYEELFTEFSVGTTRQACLSAKVKMRTEYSLSEKKRYLFFFAVEAATKVHVDELNVLKQKNVTFYDEKNSLDGKIIELQSLIFAKDLEHKDLNVAVSSLRSHNDSLVDQIEEFQDAQMKIVDDKVAKLDADLLEMAYHLEEKFYPHLLTTISGQRWLLTHCLKLVFVKCLNSSEFLTALGTAIIHEIEQGMQSGLAAEIDHVRKVDFPLLVELKSHKDASVEDIINLLCLEGPLADAPGMTDLQPDVEQLRVPIHMSEDQVVLGESSLSFSLSISHSRVEQISANITAERSALMDVWTPLSEPLYIQNLIGVASTSDSMPTVVATITAISTTFTFASSISPITVVDYEVVNADGQENSQGNTQGDVASFSMVDFEKEELDTPLKRDLLN
nr:hypothetical protein [Tanacetum cinerariifolium]